MGNEKEKSFAIKLHPTNDPFKVEENKRLITDSCQTCGYPYAQGGDSCDICAPVAAARRARRADEFHQTLFGGSVTHIYGVGYVRDDELRRRGMLDG